MTIPQGRKISYAVKRGPAADYGARVGIETVLRTLVRLLALQYGEDKFEAAVQLFRELAFDDLNNTSLEGLNSAQQEEIFSEARQTIGAIFDPNLSTPATRLDRH
jgi:hypothetical protein